MASGGSGTYAWSLVSVSLPPGLSLRTDVPGSFPAGASAGLIGVATTAGTYNFTLQVTSNGKSSTQPASMYVSALILKDPYQFPDAFANVPFPTYTLTPLNNAGPVTYKLSSGVLPPGMSMSASGVISGIPTTAGSYSWTVQFTDGVDTEYRGLSINVYAIEITTPGQLRNALQNAAYNVTLSASGGAGGYTFTSGALPNGLTLSSAGTISGTVTAGPGRWPFSVTATDSNGTSYIKQMSIEVIGGSQFPSIALYGNGNWDDCTVGVACSRNGQANGGVAPYGWTATGLPPGMSIRFGSGVTSSYIVPGDFELWGTPTVLGTFNVQLTVTDSDGAATTAILPLKVSSLTLDYLTDLPNGALNSAYSNKFRVLGGSNSYSASLVGSELADGLSLNSISLVVSGIPLENGNLSASFQFADTASDTLQATNYYTISAGVSTTAIYTNSNLGTWTIGSNLELYLYACCGSSYVWTVIGGALPPGLNLSTSGVLSGAPTTAGTYTFLIEAADSSNPANIGIRQFTMAVTPIAVTAAASLPYGNVGFRYSQALAATGGTGTLTWTLAPFNYLPPGLSLSSSGNISGTPMQTGQFQFTVNVTDAALYPGAITFTISVFPAPATRYVSPAGSDSNPGSLSQPYLTIQKCATTVYGGSTCFIRAGTYRETITPNSGVTIMPYNGESVTVDGTDPVTNWTIYQGSIYRASITLNNDDTNQVFVGQQMMTEVRWPNGDDLFHVNWATAQAGTNDSRLVDSNLPNEDWTGAKVRFLSGSDTFAGQTATITGSAPGALTMVLDSPDGSGAIPGTTVELPPGAIQPQPGGLYYLYRSLAALDKQGEWFYDRSTNILYFWAPGNVNPNTLNVRANRRQYAFELSGRTNVTIKGIRLLGCAIDMDASSANNILDGINVQYISHYTDLVSGAGSWNVHTADSGIILNGSGNILRNSAIAWSAGNGVSLLGNGNTIQNNLIANTGYSSSGASGIRLVGSGHLIHNNTIYTSGYTSVFICSYNGNPANNDDIAYNNVFSAMMLTEDGGAIYVTCQYPVSGTHIHHNWLHDTHTPFPVGPGYPRTGVYIDEDSSGYEVDQNVLWNNEYYNIHLHGSSGGLTTPFNNFIHNNSIPDIGQYAYINVQGVMNCGTTLIQDNLVLETVQQRGTNPNCTTVNNSPTAPGATDMTANVQVGCNFAGCSSDGPPVVSGTSVGPSIVLQPLPAIVAAGQSATFTVTADGSPTLTYQWQRNAANIPGATSASYTTPPTTFADNGAVFSIQVSNSLGTVASDPAVLVVGATPVLAPVITGVANAEGGSTTIAPNTWVSISGSALAPVGDSRIWQGSDFSNGQMPSKLDGVSVSMNGENAYVYYISPGQINVLTPLDLAPGLVQIAVTSSGITSDSFTAQGQATSPSFFIFGGGPYVVATHANGSLIGPVTLYPGQTTPAKPGEVIILYANGFGPVSPPVAAGSAVQVGNLPTLPTIQIGGSSAPVQFAGLASPGLYQFNVVVPPILADGDQPIVATYNGVSTQAGTLLTVQN